MFELRICGFGILQICDAAAVCRVICSSNRRHSVLSQTSGRYSQNWLSCFVISRFCLRNDLYCVGWGVKLCSLTRRFKFCKSGSAFEISYIVLGGALNFIHSLTSGKSGKEKVGGRLKGDLSLFHCWTFACQGRDSFLFGMWQSWIIPL